MSWRAIGFLNPCIISTCTTAISCTMARRMSSSTRVNTAWGTLSARCLLCCVSPDISWSMMNRCLGDWCGRIWSRGRATNQWSICVAYSSLLIAWAASTRHLAGMMSSRNLNPVCAGCMQIWRCTTCACFLEPKNSVEVRPANKP